MNNKTKGWIAAGLGGALLLGTGGTFALWSVEDEVGGGVVNTGHAIFDFEGEDPPAVYWEDDEFLVPGKSVEGTVEIPVSLLGRGLSVDFEAEAIPLDGPFNPAVAEFLETEVVSVQVAGGDLQTGSTGVITVDDVDDEFEGTVTVTLKATLLEEAGEGTKADTMDNLNVDLGDITVTLTQIDPTP